MLYFILAHPSVTGVGLNVSRMMQVVILLFFMRLAIIGRISFRSSILIKSRYSLFVLYFSLAVMSGVIGLFIGVYSFDIFIDIRDYSYFGYLMTSPYIRPCFAYVILAYYIGYFVILPSIILKKEEDIKYFFKVFFLMFNISLFVGLIEFFLEWQYSIHFIGRQMYELYSSSGPISAGVRFHGVFGEPRDAFVLLGLGAAFYCLKSTVFNTPQSKYYYALILLCAFLTKSNSGLIGVAFFIMLYSLIIFLDFNLKHSIRVLILISVLGVVLYFVIVNEYRMQHTVKCLTVGLAEMYYERDIPPIISDQVVDIYPLFWIVDNLYQFNPIPFLLGGGPGSPAFVSNLLGETGLENPHADITRVIGGTGIIGCFIYISAFYIPVKRITMQLPYRIRKNIILFMILVLSLTLGHRSAASFIFFGVLCAAFNIFTEANRKKGEDLYR